MATYSVTRSKHATLTANASDTVTLTGGPKFKHVEVINRGSVELYFRTDGTAPTVGGDNSYVVLAGTGLIVDSFLDPDAVKVISAASTAYSVTGIN